MCKGYGSFERSRHRRVTALTRLRGRQTLMQKENLRISGKAPPSLVSPWQERSPTGDPPALSGGAMAIRLYLKAITTASSNHRSNRDLLTESLNRPQRERLPYFKSGISVIKKIKLTAVTCAVERFAFSES